MSETQSYKTVTFSNEEYSEVVSALTVRIRDLTQCRMTSPIEARAYWDQKIDVTNEALKKVIAE